MFEKESYHGADHKENRNTVVAKLGSLGYSLPTNFLSSSNSDMFTATAHLIIDPAMDIPYRLLSWDDKLLLPDDRWNMRLCRDEGSISGNIVLLPLHIPPSSGISVPRAQRKRAYLKIEAKKGRVTTKIHNLYDETPYKLEVFADGDIKLYIPPSFRGLLRLTAPSPKAQQPQVILCDELKGVSTPIGHSRWSRERRWYVGETSDVLNKTEKGDEVVANTKTGRISVYYVEDLSLETD